MFGFWIEGSGLGFRVISLLGYERPAKADSCIRIRVCFPDLAMDVREAKLTSCLGFAQRSPRTLGEASVGWLIDRGALYMVQGDNGFQRKPGAKRVECLSIFSLPDTRAKYDKRVDADCQAGEEVFATIQIEAVMNHESDK